MLDWPAVWRDMAARLDAHSRAGRGHLLTEDVVRMETVLALGTAGVAPGRLGLEYIAPELGGGKLDLVIDPPDGVLVELKYPRDSRTGISPDTMTLGELVRDFLRVAAVPAQQRWVVQVLNPRLARYLAGLAARLGLHWALEEGDELELHPDVIAGLPKTATTAIGRAAMPETVIGRCEVVAPIDGGRVTLYGYFVQARGVGPARPRPALDVEASLQVEAPARMVREATARFEILQAVDAITTRSGQPTFTLADVVHELRSSHYAESTIRTMVASHLCAQSQGPGIDTHRDLDRVDRGVYRRRAPESGSAGAAGMP